MKKGISFLSVIVPAYNEIKTFKILVNYLLKLKFDGIRIEIIIIESDLEYDPKNFKFMLEPIIKGKNNFVLGSRIKNGILCMRNFKDRKILSLVFNILHIILTSIFNITYQKYILDPWTCYRLFPAYCLKKIEFKRQGFDFDTELICKLI